MANKLAVRGGLKKAAKKTALKKSAKKVPGKKAAKKAPGKKAPGKKAPGKKAPGKKAATHAGDQRVQAFHHLQRAAAVISLLEGESGGDLRGLLEEGILLYGQSNAVVEALGMLRAAEHLAMAGLYAARVAHRLDVEEPSIEVVERLIDEVALELDGLEEMAEAEGMRSRLPLMAAELLGRAEAAIDSDLHLAWELAMAAEGICAAMAV
jgi:hypothetical protein